MQKTYYLCDQIVAPEARSIPARGELRCSASIASSKKSTTVVLARLDYDLLMNNVKQVDQ